LLAIIFPSCNLNHSPEKITTTRRSPAKKSDVPGMNLFSGSESSMKIIYEQYYKKGKKEMDSGTCKLDFDTFHLINFTRYYDYKNFLTSMNFTTDKGLYLNVDFYFNGLKRGFYVSNLMLDGFHEGIEREFAFNGEFVYQSIDLELPNCPDDHSHDKAYYCLTKKYSDHQLVYEGQIYVAMKNYQGDDSVGIWKFYENGKIAQVKNFPSWKILYKKEHRCEPGFEIPHKI
jgi:hypothetical protein